MTEPQYDTGDIAKISEYDSLRDEIERLRAESDLALGEATRLLESFVHEHCSPVPEWKPLPDLVGVISQLSNAVTITRTYKAEIERLQAALTEIASDICSRSGQVDIARRALKEGK